jgi:hypothetical protein
MDASFEVAVTRLDLAELAGRRGDLEAANEHLGRCRESFADLGAPVSLDRGRTAGPRVLSVMSRGGPLPAAPRAVPSAGFRLSYPHRLRRWPVAGENGMIGRSVAAVAVVLVLVSPCSV